MKAPCKGCADRHQLCHSHCEKYAEFRREIDKQKKQQDMDRKSIPINRKKKNWVY